MMGAQPPTKITLTLTNHYYLIYLKIQVNLLVTNVIFIYSCMIVSQTWEYNYLSHKTMNKRAKDLKDTSKKMVKDVRSKSSISLHW